MSTLSFETIPLLLQDSVSYSYLLEHRTVAPTLPVACSSERQRQEVAVEQEIPPALQL